MIDAPSWVLADTRSRILGSIEDISNTDMDIVTTVDITMATLPQVSHFPVQS